MNNSLSFSVRLLTLLAVCVAISACAPSLRPDTTGAQSPLQAAQRNSKHGNYARAAELYAYAARQKQPPGQRDALRVQAALAALQAQRHSMAEQQLAKVNPAHLDSTQQQRYELARTLLRIASLSPEQALQQLPPPSGHMAPGLAAHIWKLRAELLFAQYKYVAGIHNLVQRSIWLMDQQAQRRNNQLIFSYALEAVTLGRGPDSPAAQQADATTLGWLRLAAIKRHGPSGAALQQALKQWEDRFTGHPATAHLLLEEFGYKPYSSPQPIAPTTDVSDGPMVLFLPLSGTLAQPARAIRAGFRHAHKRSNSERRVVIIDSSDLNAHALVQRARGAGAALIVGPLKKAKVAALARQAPRIPVLALNQVANISTPPWFYRYALAPEDDARTAAAHAAANGWQRALALVPEGDWGRRVLQAFRDAFNKRGGTLVDHASFVTSRYDHQNAVQSVLQSYHRGARVDFVFIAARPTHARLLHSQLRFFHAAKLPVTATSDVYSGQAQPRRDADLNGVAFAAIPWVMRHNPNAVTTQQAQASRAIRRFPRLFAMGIDAWHLANQLAGAGLQTGMTLHGATGVLEVLANGRIRRHLAWARFDNGRAHLVEPAAAGSSGVITDPFMAPATTPAASAQPSQRRRRPADTTTSYGPVYTEPAATREQQHTPDSDAYGPVYTTAPQP